MDYHLFAEYTISDDQYLIIWPPEKEVFEKALSEKSLDGTITKREHSVTLLIKSPADRVLDFLEKHPDAFDTREPIVYRKLN
ncbi:MAG: hypothetical protein KDN20_25825 [Verrucomicrobiae bacterium]|nr:hypothetical protein [Verrucomicrobiae bacterium]